MIWWNVPICGRCWNGRAPVRALSPEALAGMEAVNAFMDEPCFLCAERPHVGIYVRLSTQEIREARTKAESPTGTGT